MRFWTVVRHATRKHNKCCDRMQGAFRKRSKTCTRTQLILIIQNEPHGGWKICFRRLFRARRGIRVLEHRRLYIYTIFYCCCLCIFLAVAHWRTLPWVKQDGIWIFDMFRYTQKIYWDWKSRGVFMWNWNFKIIHWVYRIL